MKNTESLEKSRKRSRTSEDAEDSAVGSGGKKARGRPRVDTQDATAADRRRTQIRLAQRAYRQRKETTISSLKQQSSQLHAIIDEMNKTFLRYNESIIQSGVLQSNPGLAEEMTRTNENFASYVKTANERSLESDGEDAAAAEPVSRPRDDVVAAAVTQTSPSQANASSRETQPWGYTISSQTFERARPDGIDSQPDKYLANISSSSYNLPDLNNQSDLMQQYRFSVGEVLDQSRSMKTTQQSQAADATAREQSQQEHNQAPLPFGLFDVSNREQSSFVPPYIFPVDIPAIGAELPPPARARRLSATPLTTMTLVPAYTYAYQESTFARRLMRATIEAGLLLLCSPHIHPSILEHIFKLSLPYLTLEEIRNRFKNILSRGVTEDLDWYATPFLHLGGAGTHYQRRDANGKPIPMKNTWTIRQIGPLDRRMVRIECMTDGQTQDLRGIDLTGFEGEWLDAYDVQGYLEEQWNCRIDPKSSFAECLIEDESAANSDNEESSPSLSLSRGSTASNSDTSTPPVQTSSTFQPSYGLPMFFDSASMPNLFSASSKQSFLDMSADQTLGLDLAPGFDMGFAGRSGYSPLGVSMMSEIKRLPAPRQKLKKAAWVDVQKFVDSTIRGAVCLGRAPGYRRKDVDVAFREAIIHAT